MADQEMTTIRASMTAYATAVDCPRRQSVAEKAFNKPL
jgi:hypothetical protein